MKNKLRRRSIAVVGLTFVMVGFGLGPAKSQLTSPVSRVMAAVETNQPGLYLIIHFSDGDTFTINMNGSEETIRFIGVDTPETHDPRKKVQCGGPAASAYTKNSLTDAGLKVRLAADSQSGNRDRYGRLLRYVYLPDGTLWNEKLITDGYGFYYPYFTFDKKAEFATAQKQAQAAGKGIWGNCHPIATDQGGYKSNDL